MFRLTEGAVPSVTGTRTYLTANPSYAKLLYTLAGVWTASGWSISSHLNDPDKGVRVQTVKVRVRDRVLGWGRGCKVEDVWRLLYLI